MLHLLSHQGNCWKAQMNWTHQMSRVQFKENTKFKNTYDWNKIIKSDRIHTRLLTKYRKSLIVIALMKSGSDVTIIGEFPS